MRGGTLLATLAALAGCYAPAAIAPCSLTCSESSPCPDDLVCGSDGRCQEDGGQTCATMGGIFRSVGPDNSSSLAEGAGNELVIRGSRARFASALPDNTGVGDVLQYDSNGDGTVDAVAFVHERVSSTDLVVANEAGALPAPTAAPDERWTIYRAYTSLRNAANRVPNAAVAVAFDTQAGAPDLVSLGVSWNIACYADAVDRGTVEFSGWTTSPTAYLRIFTPSRPYEVGVSQRHSGTWDASKYSLETPGVGSNDNALEIVNMFARVEGLQIFVNTDGATSDLPFGLSFTDLDAAKEVYASSNIIRSSDIPNAMTKGRGFRIVAAEAGPTLYAWNNIVYDFGGTMEARGLETTGAGTTVFLYNSTFSNVFPALYGGSSDDTFIVKNTLVLPCGGSCPGGAATFRGSNNVGDVFESRGIGVALASTTVTDYVRAPDDFHINPDALHADQLLDAGVDLATDVDLSFDTDIDDELRVGVWDIGADEAY